MEEWLIVPISNFRTTTFTPFNLFLFHSSCVPTYIQKLFPTLTVSFMKVNTTISDTTCQFTTKYSPPSPKNRTISSLNQSIVRLVRQLPTLAFLFETLFPFPPLPLPLSLPPLTPLLLLPLHQPLRQAMCVVGILTFLNSSRLLFVKFLDKNAPIPLVLMLVLGIIL